jgi:hypothetical protein
VDSIIINVPLPPPPVMRERLSELLIPDVYKKEKTNELESKFAALKGQLPGDLLTEYMKANTEVV